MRTNNTYAKAIAIVTLLVSSTLAQTYPIVGTGVTEFYNANAVISEPAEGADFYGQDANYPGNLPSYTDNGDGTITDNVTGLMWEQDMGSKISCADAQIKADSLTTGSHSDWRVPTIKEVYSLIQFTGQVQGQTAMSFFIDTAYFDHPIGDTALGEREIDAQTWSSTQYVGLTMGGDTTVFGVNFVDGRIKGYPKYNPTNKSEAQTMYFRMVRDNSAYGINNFADNGDGTITDSATDLMWQTADDGETYDWQTALKLGDTATFAGHSDWRLPTIKELSSIVDYTRSPQTTSSPAIDPIFSCTEITDPYGLSGNYGYYWSSTTHLDGADPEAGACYFAFGEAQGEMTTPQGTNLLDVHGAGAQRSDPKSGSVSGYPAYWGPQGDVQYVYNFVRLVRDVDIVSPVTQSMTKAASSVSLNVTGKQINLVGLEDEAVTLQLFTVQGRLIEKQNLQAGTSTVSISTPLSAGVYMIRVVSEGVMLSQSVVVR